MATHNPTEFRIEPGKKEIEITHVFDAPRELVFRALTDPGLLEQWWGPRRYQTVIEKFEARPGGKWRMIHRDDTGEYAFRGEFRELKAPERVTWTFEWEGMPGHISVETSTLEDLGGGRTRMIARSVFDSQEDRDGMVASGMEEGTRESYERLDEVLARELQVARAG